MLQDLVRAERRSNKLAPVPARFWLLVRDFLLQVPAAFQAVPSDAKAHEGAGIVTIRALADLPPFVGPDMQTYMLKQGDVATVPPSIAQLLVRRNKASIIDAA